MLLASSAIASSQPRHIEIMFTLRRCRGAASPTSHSHVDLALQREACHAPLELPLSTTPAAPARLNGRLAIDSISCEGRSFPEGRPMAEGYGCNRLRE
jgi:hypothetical protein